AARGLKSLVLERSTTCAYFFPRASPSLFVQARLNRAHRSYRRARRRAPVAGVASGALTALASELAPIPYPFHGLTPDEIAASAARVRNLASFWSDLLERVRPRLALVTQYYDAEAMALLLACRERGIPSVDLQHGMQGALHFAYGRWSRIPRGG